MLLKRIFNILFTLSLAGYGTTVIAQEGEEEEDPRKMPWLEQCMQDSGWYNEDGMAYCSCVGDERGYGAAYNHKVIKGTKAGFTCAGKLPSKEENPKRNWTADCVTSGAGNYKFCHCLSDKLTGPVELKAWIATPEGKSAQASCK